MADFRSIAPSTHPSSQAEQSSSPSSSKQSIQNLESGGGTSGGTSGGPGGSTSGGTSGGASGPSSRGAERHGKDASGKSPGDGGHKRRRGVGAVTNLACTECRRARAKCDGLRPSPCHRCIQRELKCVYESHTKTHKDDLLREIGEMKAEHAGLRATTSMLLKDRDDLQDKEQAQSVILDILANNGHDREIIRRLRAGDRREDVAKWLLSQPDLRRHLESLPTEEDKILDMVKRVENLYTGNESPPLMSLATTHQWTNVTKSKSLVRHLLGLYFTWVHPVHMLLSEADFINSFSSGDNTYCSGPLVNAICAMGCHLLHDPEEKSGPLGKGSISGYHDAEDLQTKFLVEARLLLTPDEYRKMTSIQAFAIMFLAELSSGQAQKATGYLRSAADNLKLRETGGQKEEALQLSYWGIHTLNTAWSGFTYQKPFASESPRSEVYLNGNLDQNMRHHQWRYYRQPGDETNVPGRTSYAILTAFHQARLFRIVHLTINIYCGARGRVTAETVIECYKRYLDWAESLPEPIRKADIESQPLPHVLCLQCVIPRYSKQHSAFALTLMNSIQYHTALVQLLAPLLECGYFSNDNAEEIRVKIIGHALNGHSLMSQLKRLYSCRFNVPVTTFCLLHLGDTIVRYSMDDPLISNPANIAMEFLDALQQNRSGFALCGPLQQMLRWTIKGQGISLPNSIDDQMGSDSRFGVEDLLNACTRLSYSQPVELIVGYIHRRIAETWPQEWEKHFSQPRTPITSRVLEIQSLLNN